MPGAVAVKAAIPNRDGNDHHQVEEWAHNVPVGPGGRLAGELATGANRGCR
jgi:hypothetical protein